MRREIVTGILAVALLALPITTHAQGTSIVREVRTALNCTTWPCSPVKDFSAAETALDRYRAASGTTSQALEALSWLGRGALAAGDLERANAYAADAQDLAVGMLTTRKLTEDASLETALGAAIEVQAQVRAAQGRRSDAVYFLRREADTYRQPQSLHMRIQKNLNLLSMEGEPAPALEAGDTLGRRLPAFQELRGKVVVMFFWAHWCGECKAQGPVLARLLEEHRDAGLTIIAPTQRYGYVVARQPTTRDDELQHIARVRDQYYAFLREEAVPVSEANHSRYGVSTTPTLVLVDRRGVVRLYHPGTMTADQLTAAIRPLLAGAAH